MIPWMIDRSIVKGVPKKEFMKAKVFDSKDKKIVYDFLGYSHSLSLLQFFSKDVEQIIFFGAASFSGEYETGDIVYPNENFIFLKYEDRFTKSLKLDEEKKVEIKEKFNIKSAPSMTVDYAGFFPLEEFRQLSKFKNNLFIEMEWGFIFRWAKRHNIEAYPIYILTDKWGEKVRISDKIKRNFKKTFEKIMEEM